MDHASTIYVHTHNLILNDRRDEPVLAMNWWQDLGYKSTSHGNKKEFDAKISFDFL
jgi:hypothetical protein